MCLIAPFLYPRSLAAVAAAAARDQARCVFFCGKKAKKGRGAASTDCCPSAVAARTRNVASVGCEGRDKHAGALFFRI